MHRLKSLGYPYTQFKKTLMEQRRSANTFEFSGCTQISTSVQEEESTPGDNQGDIEEG